MSSIEWPHVALCGSEKAFREMRLFPSISPSTASLEAHVAMDLWEKTEVFDHRNGAALDTERRTSFESRCFILSHKVSVSMFSISPRSDLCSISSWEEKLFQITNRTNPSSLYTVQPLCKAAQVLLFRSWLNKKLKIVCPFCQSNMGKVEFCILVPKERIFIFRYCSFYCNLFI